MRFLLLTFALCVLPEGVVARAFHVDATAGDDTSDGLTPATAWRSLAKTNAHAFEPGDSLLFRRGERWIGQFAPTGGSGTEGSPVFVGAYGEGPRPLIEGEGQVQDAVLIRNLSHWIVTTLEVTNLGATRASGSRRTGVHVLANNFGVMRGVRLRDLVVRDVNGSLVKHNTQEGHGILFAATGGQNISRFDDLVIEDCLLERTDRNGISQYRSNSNPRSTGVIIRRNRLEDIGGDGIKIWGSSGALVEHNVVKDGRMRAQDHAAGIWPFDADRTVIQFNEVSGMRGTLDGQAFDADYYCDSTIIQYNYSYNNEGGFLLLCAPGWSYSSNTIVRYNVSVADGINSARVIQLGGAITDNRIYNNTIYIAPGQNLPMISSNWWDNGVANRTHFYNNIFYVAEGGRVTYDLSASNNHLFDNNVFFGNHVGRPQDANAVLSQPLLESPGAFGAGFSTAEAYRILSTDPQFANARIVPNNGGRDFFGNPVPVDAPPHVGAHQFIESVRVLALPSRGRGNIDRGVDRAFDVRGVAYPMRSGRGAPVPLFTFPPTVQE